MYNVVSGCDCGYTGVMIGRQIAGMLALDMYGLSAGDTARFADEQACGMAAPTDPQLCQTVGKLRAADVNSPAVQQVIERLKAAAAGQRRNDGPRGKSKRTLVGLAAPQIGEPYAIVLIDTAVDESRKHFGRLECFINPQILWHSRETAEGREGCFSAGPVWGLVRRPVAVKIRALTLDGQETERIFENFTARIACHEIDHLSGIRFPERITSDKKRHWVHTEELAMYPEHIQHWPRICSRERWLAFRDGKS